MHSPCICFVCKHTLQSFLIALCALSSEGTSLAGPFSVSLATPPAEQDYITFHLNPHHFTSSNAITLKTLSQTASSVFNSVNCSIKLLVVVVSNVL